MILVTLGGTWSSLAVAAAGKKLSTTYVAEPEEGLTIESAV